MALQPPITITWLYLLLSSFAFLSAATAGLRLGRAEGGLPFNLPCCLQCLISSQPRSRRFSVIPRGLHFCGACGSCLHDQPGCRRVSVTPEAAVSVQLVVLGIVCMCTTNRGSAGYRDPRGCRFCAARGPREVWGRKSIVEKQLNEEVDQ